MEWGEVMDIHFRLFSDWDYDELKGMIYSLYREDPEGERINQDKISKTVSEYRRHPDKISIIIFELDGIIIGYSIVVLYWSNEYGGNIACIDEIYIKPEYRNRGFATYFIKTLEEKYVNVVGMQLFTTPSNTKALKLYELLGFRKDGNVHLARISKVF